MKGEEWFESEEERHYEREAREAASKILAGLPFYGDHSAWRVREFLDFYFGLFLKEQGGRRLKSCRCRDAEIFSISSLLFLRRAVIKVENSFSHLEIT